MRKGIRLAALLLVVLLAAAQAVSVSAAEIPDMSRTGSISVTMLDGQTPVPGGEWALYKVGDVQEENGDYSCVLSAPFAASKVSLDDVQSETAAKDLAAYAAQEKLEGTELAGDQKGYAKVSGLELGLYLLVQTQNAQGYYTVEPFLVTVPLYDGKTYDYDVDASPKLELKKEPASTEPTDPSSPTDPDGTGPTTDPTADTTKPTTSTKPGTGTGTGTGSKLPQTGQTNWPIPVLAVLGLTLIAIGWALCDGRRNYEDA